ncbi:hypothetical protein [Vibrio crassostreae]|uniref:hypothetical protein n=1 Tax=Vibrio crassostreae TaxID=246167 RepID=UPI001B3069B6|nr:hypothetical protein [Vibrio crassostreae]
MYDYDRRKEEGWVVSKLMPLTAILAVIFLGAVVIQDTLLKEKYMQNLTVITVGTCKGGTSAFEEPFGCIVKAVDDTTGDTYILEHRGNVIVDQKITRACWKEDPKDEDSKVLCTYSS